MLLLYYLCDYEQIKYIPHRHQRIHSEQTVGSEFWVLNFDSKSPNRPLDHWKKSWQANPING